jgi:hypothetical protein
VRSTIICSHIFSILDKTSSNSTEARIVPVWNQVSGWWSVFRACSWAPSSNCHSVFCDFYALPYD